MTVLLRPHHLLCILTYTGAGYSPAFTANMAAVIARIAAGEKIEIVDGPDDICAPLCNGRIVGRFAHCHRRRVAARDRAAADDIGKLLAVMIRPGVRMVLDEAAIHSLRREFATTRARSACTGCRWHARCNAVAAGRYADTGL